MQHLSEIPDEKWGDNEERLWKLYVDYTKAHMAYWSLLDTGYWGSTKHKGTPGAKGYWTDVKHKERRADEFGKLIGVSPWEKLDN